MRHVPGGSFRLAPLDHAGFSSGTTSATRAIGATEAEGASGLHESFPNQRRAEAEPNGTTVCFGSSSACPARFAGFPHVPTTITETCCTQ